LGNQRWETPWELFDKLHVVEQFTIDVAAEPHNTKLLTYLTGPCLAEDCECGLCFDWTGHKVWCNPPYEDILPWVYKAQGNDVMMLLQSDTSTDWFWQVWQSAASVTFLKPRVNFIGTQTGNNKGSILVRWLPEPRSDDSPRVRLWNWRTQEWD
jgi:phage N-6-adenine-methyltransferase